MSLQQEKKGRSVKINDRAHALMRRPAEKRRLSLKRVIGLARARSRVPLRQPKAAIEKSELSQGRLP